MCILKQLLNINENKNRLCNLRVISLEILSFLIYVVVYIPVFHLISFLQACTIIYIQLPCDPIHRASQFVRVFLINDLNM